MDYIEICKENMALQQENKQLKEQLAIREKALELALSNLYYADKEYYIGTAPSQEEYVEQKTKYWIEQAKESIDNEWYWE